MQRAEGNTGEGQPAHSRTTSDDEHRHAFGTHARELFANAVKCFPVREGVCPCKGMCRPSLLSSPRSPVSQHAVRQERNKGEREDHISQSQLCAGDLRTWPPAISHEHLPSVSSPNTISSPSSGIDFRLTGLVIAGADVAECLPTLV